MDFKFCVLAFLLRSPSLAMQESPMAVRIHSNDVISYF